MTRSPTRRRVGQYPEYSDQRPDMSTGWNHHGATLAAGETLGLDAFHFYCIGRGGVLGDVEPAVVASAFGYFHPAVVDQLWTEGRAIIAPRDAATAYLAAPDEFGRSRLADVEGLDAFNDAAEAIIAHVDGSALALYVGVAAEQPPVASDADEAALRAASGQLP